MVITLLFLFLRLLFIILITPLPFINSILSFTDAIAAFLTFYDFILRLDQHLIEGIQSTCNQIEFVLLSMKNEFIKSNVRLIDENLCDLWRTENIKGV